MADTVKQYREVVDSCRELFFAKIGRLFAFVENIAFNFRNGPDFEQSQENSSDRGKRSGFGKRRSRT